MKLLGILVLATLAVSVVNAAWVSSYAGTSMLGAYVFRGAENSASDTEPVVSQIKEMVQNQATTGSSVRSMADELNVTVKEVTIANIQRLRERITERVMNASETRELVRERTKEAKAVRYDYAFELSSIEMEKIIEYLESKNINTSELGQIRDEFYQKYSDLQENESQDEIIGEMRQISSEFTEKVKELATDHAAAASEYALQYMNQNNASMNQIRAENWGYMKNVSLDIFDRRVENAERVLSVFENHSIIDVTQLRASLQEITAMRTQLEAAFNAQNEEQAKNVTEQIREMWREYKNLHAQAVREQARIRTAERLEKFVAAAEAKAQKCGMEMNTEEIRASIQEAKNSPDAIPELKAEFESLRETFRNVVECQEGSS